MQNDNWIKELKVGDKVVTQVGLYGGKQIVGITKITPKGFIKTENGYVFNPDGSERGGDTWRRASLSRLTDKVQKEIRHKKLTYELKTVDYSKLSLEQLEKIITIIKEEQANV